MHTDSSFLQTLFHQLYISVYFALHLQFICSFIYLNAHFCQTPHYWRLTLSWQNEHRLSLSCTCSLRYLSIWMSFDIAICLPVWSQIKYIILPKMSLPICMPLCIFMDIFAVDKSPLVEMLLFSIFVI